MIKVLWITNIMFPEAVSLLTGQGELKASGGWLLGAANALLRSDEVQLTVASVSPLVQELTFVKGEKINYYALPMGKGNTRINYDYEPLWKQVKQEVKPDVVHIHGTEFSHGYAYVRACGVDNVVVSIQGLVSAYYYYYYYDISSLSVMKNITLRDLRSETIFHGQKDFRIRGEYEKALLKEVHHIIGRTSWDRSRTWAINPNAEYHFCNETLRDEFYDGSKWNYNKCVPHSIFISQGSYPIKGLHQVLKAMPLILRHYPDTMIRVAGTDITQERPVFGRLGITGLLGYGKVIKGIIYKYDLSKHLTFTGGLDAEQMKNEYLKSNVFICPSSIENSPNSLGEAQILGVPHLCSYIGGAMDMMKGNEECLYRFEETECLAYKVCSIFASGAKQVDMSQEALKRHDPEINRKQLLSIYANIVSV